MRGRATSGRAAPTAAGVLRLLALLVAATVAVGCTTATPEPAPEPTPAPSRAEAEDDDPRSDGLLRRAVIVSLDDGALTTTAGIHRLVDDLWTAHATDLVVQVVGDDGTAYYDSDVLPRTTDPALESGLDVLATVLEAAAAREFEVHAWVPVTRATAGARAPVPDAVATAHGAAAPVEERWVTRTVDGTWQHRLDPALPEVTSRLTDVVAELAGRYDVDGVHLGDVGYAAATDGYHPRALARFRDETGAVGTPAPDDPGWSAWRRRQVDALVGAARDAATGAGRTPLLSVAVVAEGPAPTVFEAPAAGAGLTRQLEDWPRWAVDGSVDAVVPVTRVRGDDAGTTVLEGWLAFEQDLAARARAGVVPAVAGDLGTRETTLDQIGLAAERLGSVAVHTYRPAGDEPSDGLWWWLAATDWTRRP